MRSSALQRGVVLSLTPFVLVALFHIPAGHMATDSVIASAFHQASATSSVEQRIERVENGLLPPTIMQGEAPARMKLADRMRFYKTPGVSIAVINDGKIDWARGVGVKEVHSTEPVNSETVFQSASISKTVVAMAALRLVEQGKLDLDGDVNQKLVSWKIPENEFTRDQKVTLRRLLSHSAGVTVPGFLGYESDQPVPTLMQILEGAKPANSAPIRVDIVPGTKWRYAGGGYVILQQLISDVTKLGFAQFMKLAVLDKLGMSHSAFEQPLSSVLAANAAAGHLPDGKEIIGKWFVYPELAPAGLWTTPTDLARFLIEIQQSRIGKSNKVLSMAMTSQMLKPVIENSGLGLFVDGQGNSARFSFGGANVGFKCNMVAYLNSGSGVVVMTNSENGAELISEIFRSVAAEYGWPDYRPKEKIVAKIDPRIYDSYVGEYEIAPGFTLVVTREGDKLMSQATGQPKSELFPESDTVFFVKDANAQFTFVRKDGGEVIQVNIQRSNRLFQAKKIK